MCKVAVILKKAAGSRNGDGMKKLIKKGKIDAELITDSLNIPGASVSLPILTLIGNKEMYIENIKAIMEYDDENIRVLTRRGQVCVRGEHLDIGYLDNDEISIKGRIAEITFD